MLVGQVAISELRNMVIYSKMWFRLQLGILKDHGPFTSKRILAFKFQPCPDPLISWGCGGSFGSGCCLRSIVLSSALTLAACVSKIQGKNGNIEYLGHFKRNVKPCEIDIGDVVDQAFL